MAKQTDIQLRSVLFYQVFPRQHSPSRDFAGVTKDLDRMRAMGVDILYLLPIHPIGKQARKGTVGSPYSIVDYYTIHEDYGTLDDFKHLVSEAHKRDMKVMMDIVFNHTARDAVLVDKHPEWYVKDEKGGFANRVGEWSDITDLDFGYRPVWDYLIDVLIFWAGMVDGFRCDVAPLLPIDFWHEARQKVDAVKPGLIWLTESVQFGFIKYLRDMGFDCESDSTMYDVFDICYDYDIFDFMVAYLNNSKQLSRWLEEIFRQEVVYPKNYVKLRSFENHDQERLRSRVRNHDHFIQMTALNFFIKGPVLLYAGQEHAIHARPNLFEYDPVPWQPDQTIEPLIAKLARIKKKPIFAHGNYAMHHDQDVAVLSYTHQQQFLVGIFNLEDKKEIQVPLADGTYVNIINDQAVQVEAGKIMLGHEPIIIDTDRSKRI